MAANWTDLTTEQLAVAAESALAALGTTPPEGRERLLAIWIEAMTERATRDPDQPRCAQCQDVRFNHDQGRDHRYQPPVDPEGCLWPQQCGQNDPLSQQYGFSHTLYCVNCQAEQDAHTPDGED